MIFREGVLRRWHIVEDEDWILFYKDVLLSDRMGAFDELPEECIAAILSRTTPVDAVRLSLVSKTLRSAADSDAVWNHFIPSYPDFIETIVSKSPTFANIRTKKAVYLALCDRYIIISDYEDDNARKSFQLDKKSGKDCYTFSARFLDFTDSMLGFSCSRNIWTLTPDSRFTEVAARADVGWTDFLINICGRINTIDLSPNTQYAAYLVFKVIDVIGCSRPHVEFSVGVGNDHDDVTNPCYHTSKIVCLYRNYQGGANNTVVGLQSSIVRSDGWFEIEMGEFFNLGLENEVKMNVFMEMKDGNQNTRLLFEGIEVRPK
ncbi:putative phloem protein [Medicago truncatula]|uniref:Putative phloem protein n=1 Tax=Medicago truncatula TaxID=3880 RepID=A0A396JQM2_MEDTR|nr:putative phloem protein [Medicago truncatula]